MPQLSITATQGSNDAFVEASLQTGLTGLVTTAYRVNEIWIQWPEIRAASNNIEAVLSRRSKSAIPSVADVDVMFAQKRYTKQTTSGTYYAESVERYAPLQSLLIVEDLIYLVVDSDSTSASNSVIATIFYEVVTISEVDRLTLLTASLQS